jgi:hypothetical protein
VVDQVEKDFDCVEDEREDILRGFFDDVGLLLWEGITLLRKLNEVSLSFVQCQWKDTSK